jgi:aspartate 1-decarboxylase
MRVMLKSKIHRACITDAYIDYEGSITIDKQLMDAADILPYEQVQVLDINNGARFSTYVIEGEKGEICLNGPAAKQGIKGDLVIILSYCHLDNDEAIDFKPRLVYVDNHNAIKETRQGIAKCLFKEAG